MPQVAIAVFVVWIHELVVKVDRDVIWRGRNKVGGLAKHPIPADVVSGRNGLAKHLARAHDTRDL